MRHPILRLAAIGFSSSATAELAKSVAALSAAGPRWVLARHERADAWLVHPEVADLHADHARVWDSSDRVASVTLHYDRIHRPVALASGAAAEGLTPELPRAAQQVAHLKGLDVQEVQRTLLVFEQRLRLLRAQFTFGEIMLVKRPEITKEQRGYQLTYRQQLIAMVDSQKLRVHIGAKAVPVSIDEASWQLRPVTAAEPADSEFKTFTIQECLWEFSQRSDEEWLPARYKLRPIHFWRTPSLKAGFYQDEHIGLLGLLKHASQDFAALRRQTGWTDAQLAKTIEGLWVTGAISTQAMKAVSAPGLLERLFARRSAEIDSNLPGDSSTPASTRSMDWARDTSPAELDDSDCKN